jgi:hypothetical protein
MWHLVSKAQRIPWMVTGRDGNFNRHNELPWILNSAFLSNLPTYEQIECEQSACIQIASDAAYITNHHIGIYVELSVLNLTTLIHKN